MSRTAQLSAYKALIGALADSFEPGDHIQARDLRALTDDEISVVLNHDESAGDDAYAPRVCAEIYNSVLYTTHAERVHALGKALDEGILMNVREFLARDVTTELWERQEATGDWRADAAEASGMRQADFV